MVQNHKPQLARTVMCRNAEAGVYCLHQERHRDCWFAHSREELRCVMFAKGAGCCDPRCDRVHDYVLAATSDPLEWGEAPPAMATKFAIPLPKRDVDIRLKVLVPTNQQTLRESRSIAIGECRRLLSNEDDPKARQHLLLDMEALFTKMDLLSYAQYNVIVELDASNRHHRLYKFPVPGLAENRPSVLRGDRVHVMNYATNTWMGGFVFHANVDTLVVSLPSYLTAVSFRANVFFTYSPTQDLVRHRAVQEWSSLYLTAARFGTRVTPPPVPQLQLVDKSRLTSEQQSVVTRFVRGKRLGVLLWGPPGTGKTTTLVAAIATLLLAWPTSKVLVVAPSNEAADLIVERLAKKLLIDVGALLRVNAAMRQAANVKEAVLRYSTPDTRGGFAFPSLEDLMRARVVVTTLMTSGKVYGMGVPQTHFTALAVDEAGHCTEAELLIACQAAGPSVQRILLAGDHKQLGAMVRAVPCVEGGMAVSPLERLMNDDAVPQDCKVMLTQNFRSHPCILALVNTVYEDKLTAHAVLNSPFADRAILSLDAHRHVEVGRECPLLFVHHDGEENREQDSPSWQNLKEAHMVVNAAVSMMLRDGVDPQEIVILSPYRQQVRKIEQILHHIFQHNHYDLMTPNARGKLVAPIRVYTVEMYQGREARVVFVSTVRNRHADRVQLDVQLSIGFLKQPQRANVAMSRARDAMFVFGNAMLLATDPLWRGYLDRIDAFDAIYDATRGRRVDLASLLDTEAAARTAQSVEIGAEALQLANVERPFERELN